jgi:FixJ family two-component response regulator
MQQDLVNAVGVVDDDPAVLDSFRFMLEVAGYRVLTFRSGVQLLAHTSDLPCCLILDQQMPGLTGLELVERLRSEGIMLPILLVTAWPSPAIVARAAELGIEGVLEKPPGEGEVLSFVAAHL